MKINRTITIGEGDISPLLEDLNELMGTEITGVDSKSAEGVEFVTKYPTLFKLHNLLKSEVLKEQTLFNYQRIKG